MASPRRRAALFGLGRADPLARTETWRAFFAALAVPAFALDRDGRVAAWNPACAKLTGIAAAQVMATREHWRGFYRQERPCLADVALQGGAAGSLYVNQNASEQKDQLRAENWCDLPSSGRRYLTIDAVRVRSVQGEVVAVIETLQDITQMKEMEEDLRRAQIEVEQAIGRERATVSSSIGRALERLAAGDLRCRLPGDLPEPTSSWGSTSTPPSRRFRNR